MPVTCRKSVFCQVINIEFNKEDNWGGYTEDPWPTLHIVKILAVQLPSLSRAMRYRQNVTTQLRLAHCWMDWCMTWIWSTIQSWGTLWMFSHSNVTTQQKSTGLRLYNSFHLILNEIYAGACVSKILISGCF